MSAAPLLGDVVVAADRYGDHGVLITLSDPEYVPEVVAMLGGRAGWRSVLVPGDADPERVRTRISAMPVVRTAAVGAEEVTIPVVYDGADLQRVADCVGRTAAEVIDLHTSATYTVVLLGFGRAFPYLAGLPQVLHGVPRLETPRTQVPAGSVAIVADMAGIYPAAMPGGWALLGTTPRSLFDPTSTPPTPLATGTRVRFEVVV